MTEQRATPAIRGIPLPQLPAVLGIGRSKIYDEIAAGRLAALKVGRRVIVTEAEAARWLAALPAAIIRPSRRQIRAAA